MKRFAPFFVPFLLVGAFLFLTAGQPLPNLVGAPTNPVRTQHGSSQYGLTRAVMADLAGQLDAFARFRISAPQTLFDSKLIRDKDSLYWSEKIVNTSGTAASTLITPHWRFTVGQNDTIIRQTRTWWNYQPGKSQLILMTAKLDTVAGLKSRLGQFNGNNGVFFEQRGNHLYAAYRNNGVDSMVVDTAWNLDRLNGRGLSGVNIDITKNQIYFIQYEWLGVGTHAYGIVVDGVPIACHVIGHANIDTVTYTRSPNLPLRYEATKTGAGTASITTVCSSVMSEGGLESNGPSRSVDLEGTHLDANTIDTAYCVLAMTLQPSKLGTTVRPESVDLIAETNTTTGSWFLCVNASVVGTLGFVNQPNSSVRVAKGKATSIVRGYGLGKLVGGQMSQSTRSANATMSAGAWALGCKVDTTQLDTLMLVFRPGTGNADIQATLNWREER